MCGKFTQMISWGELVRIADLVGVAVNPNDAVVTFTPMRAPPVIHLDEDDRRVVRPMTWGFTDRSPSGRRIPKLMHARGETVHKLRTFADAFQRRRGIVLAKTFNEGREIPIVDDAGDPTGKMWTQQWSYRPKDGKPFALGVVYDMFDVGRGPEYEHVQVTTPANAIISAITDRMPLVLRDEDWPLWLGETVAPLEEIIALIRTFEDKGAWEGWIEDPSKKPPRPRSRNSGGSGGRLL